MIWFWLAVIVLLPTFGLVVFRGAPYVPTRKMYIKQALTELYPISGRDVLVDIGSGDGVVLREASKRGARAIGYEINPILVLISRLLSRKDKNVEVRLADFWLSSLPDDVSVVYVFAVSRDINKIRKMMQNEANRLNREFHLITYGSAFNDLKSIKNVGAYNLYSFKSLHADKAQV